MDFLNILERIATGYIEFDREWRYVYVNQPAAQMLSRKSEELVGRSMWKVFPQLIGTVAYREFHRAAEEMVDVTFEYVSPVVGGWVEVQAIPTDTGTCVFFHDITKHRRAEEEVHRLNRDLLRRVHELQTLLNLVPVGIAVADDPNCDQIRMNPAGAKMLGISLEENASKSGPEGGKLPFRVMQNGRELGAYDLPMQQASRQNVEVRDMELEVIHDDGRVVNLFEYACPLLDEHGNVRGCLGVFVDISERKRAEKQFEAIYRLTSTLGHAESLEQVFAATLDSLEQVLNAKRGSILLVEEDGVMRFKAWRGLSDQYREAVEGHFPWASGEEPKPVLIPDASTADLGDLTALILPEGIQSLAFVPLMGERHLIGNFMVYFNEPHVFTEAELSLLHTISYHASAAIERRIAENDRLRFLERERQARSEAEEANRLKDEFLAVVSHEIRTPLNAITGWCHLLKSGKLDEDGVSRALDTITRNARSQAQLIDDILDVSRIITGKFHLQKTAVLLQQVIQAAVDSVRPSAEEKRIEFSVRFASRSISTLGEAVRLQQVVSNVLSNAVKFSSTGGLIDIVLEQDGSSARIVISDSGQGISPEFLPHVFERFRQADGSATRKHGGLGLGLAITKHILELHNGSISIHSDGIGHGTCVTVQLPLIRRGAIRGESQPRKTGPMTVSTALAGMRILAVDDHEDTLDLLEALLSQESAIVCRCRSAAEALQSVKEFEPDVLVADIAMPDEDGCSLLQKIRANPGKPLRAIAVTACVREEDQRRILDAGFDLYLPKPLAPEVLIKALSQISVARSASSGAV
jgi:PAS domain S-box-containing protein